MERTFVLSLSKTEAKTSKITPVVDPDRVDNVPLDSDKISKKLDDYICSPLTPSPLSSIARTPRVYKVGGEPLPKVKAFVGPETPAAL